MGVRRPPKRTGLAQAGTGEGAGELLRYWSGLPEASSRRGGRLLIKRVVPHAPSAPLLSYLVLVVREGRSVRGELIAHRAPTLHSAIFPERSGLSRDLEEKSEPPSLTHPSLKRGRTRGFLCCGCPVRSALPVLACANIINNALSACLRSSLSSMSIFTSLCLILIKIIVLTETKLHSLIFIFEQKTLDAGFMIY